MSKKDKSRDSEDVESQRFTDDFDDRFVRHKFIRTVYAIVFVQLLVTVSVICLFIYVEDLREFAWEHSYLVFVFSIMLLIFWLSLICFSSILRSFPCNIISVIFLTTLLSLTCGILSAHFRTDIVLISMLLTTVVVGALTIFAMQTRCDFTTCGALLLVLGVLLLILGICTIFIRSRILHLVYCSLGVLVISLYIIYDTQLIMGNRKKAYETDEYIFAALSLYADIVYMFMFLLDLVNALW